jgi:hypothetical protein
MAQIIELHLKMSPFSLLKEAHIFKFHVIHNVLLLISAHFLIRGSGADVVFSLDDRFLHNK